MTTYLTEKETNDGREFLVALSYDDDANEPWKESDCHGIVSGWERRSKRPGEFVLMADRGYSLFYDFAGTVKKALSAGWNVSPYQFRTRREQAAAAAMADYKRLRAWCGGQWHWCGVTVTLLDEDGEPTDLEDSLWGVESDDDGHIRYVTFNLINGLLRAVRARTYPVTEMGV